MEAVKSWRGDPWGFQHSCVTGSCALAQRRFDAGTKGNDHIFRPMRPQTANSRRTSRGRQCNCRNTQQNQREISDNAKPL